MKVREALDAAANIAIIVICVFFATMLGVVYWGTPPSGVNANANAASLPKPPRYAVGDVLSEFPDLKLGTAEQTLVLVFRSTCRFCTDSMPFYKKLAEEAAGTRGATRLVGITTDTAETAQEYLRQHRLQLSTVVSTTPGMLRVRGTPTLLLVDRAGAIKHIWNGQLPGGAETDVLSALSPVPLAR
jgi:peroxiredoxin